MSCNTKQCYPWKGVYTSISFEFDDIFIRVEQTQRNVRIRIKLRGIVTYVNNVHTSYMRLLMEQVTT